jgi:dTDP-4-dehydrorhamnose 3,5-epimerase-like enzyme
MMQQPTIIPGACHQDQRGALRYNNDFNSAMVKRIYLLQNSAEQPVRGWQGHRVEQRWFLATRGAFEIYTIAVDNWEQPSVDLPYCKYIIDQQKLDVLHIPSGYITAIRSLDPESALIAMSDHLLGAVKDEYRFPLYYFKDIF